MKRVRLKQIIREEIENLNKGENIEIFNLREEIKNKVKNIKLPEFWEASFYEWSDEEIKWRKEDDQSYPPLVDFSMPMEGWDEEHKDYISLIKKIKGNRYYIEEYYSFAGGDKIGPFYDFNEAIEKALKIMRKLTNETNKLNDGYV
jgi:hypothetical protein